MTSEIHLSPMKNHTPTPQPQKFRKLFYQRSGNHVDFFIGCVVLVEDALAFGVLGDLPGAPAADLTMAPLASTAVAPAVQRRNNVRAAVLSSSSTFTVGCPGGMLYPLVRMCLAQVQVLPTAFTKLTGTNCLEVSAGNVGQMSLPLVGGTRALRMCELPGGGGGGGGRGRSSRLWAVGLQQ